MECDYVERQWPETAIAVGFARFYLGLMLARWLYYRSQFWLAMIAKEHLALASAENSVKEIIRHRKPSIHAVLRVPATIEWE
jgi:hypothetical protein